MTSNSLREPSKSKWPSKISRGTTRCNYTPVGRSCRPLLWPRFVGHSCGTLLRGTLVRHSCENTFVRPSCRTLLWGTPLSRSLGHYGTLLRGSLAGRYCRPGHSCGTVLRGTLEGQSCWALSQALCVAHLRDTLVGQSQNQRFTRDVLQKSRGLQSERLV